MKVYLSHSIRGKSGSDATYVEMEKNCQAAITIGELIKYKLFMVDLYIPGKHENFIGIALRDGYLTEKQVLEIDCKIIDTCDAVVVYVPEDDELQGGRLIEHDHAFKTNKPVFVFSDYNAAMSWLNDLILRRGWL